MARCPHGFMPHVKCPVGCHSPAPAAPAPEQRFAHRHKHTRAVTEAQIAEAIDLRGSLNGAALSLGISPTTITNRARSSAAIRTALTQRDRSKTPHSGFIDMIGWERSGWKVLRAVPATRGCARWESQHHCGGVEVLEGIRLRNSPPKYCAACRPKRAGTVTRRSA